jgi:hypothetical protein
MKATREPQDTGERPPRAGDDSVAARRREVFRRKRFTRTPRAGIIPRL